MDALFPMYDEEMPLLLPPLLSLTVHSSRVTN